MWFLIKTFVGMIALGLLAYFTFFTPLGDKPLAAHAGDVWTSSVVQEKVTLLRSGVQENLERKLEQAAIQSVKDKVSGHGGHAEISEADRKSLEQLLSQ